MQTRGNWIRRRWLDFRHGHTIYLIFLMTFANFIIIQYALLIQRVPELESLFGNLGVFASLFVAVYVPLAIGIGYWHRKSQLKIEQEAIFNENSMNARMWLFMMELIEGKATEAEKAEMRKMLSGIVRKMYATKESENKNVMDEETKPLS